MFMSFRSPLSGIAAVTGAQFVSGNSAGDLPRQPQLAVARQVFAVRVEGEPEAM
jgi:hypothetical protein